MRRKRDNSDETIRDMKNILEAQKEGLWSLTLHNKLKGLQKRRSKNIG